MYKLIEIYKIYESISGRTIHDDFETELQAANYIQNEVLNDFEEKEDQQITEYRFTITKAYKFVSKY